MTTEQDNVATQESQHFVTHSEFSEFKEADTAWKSRMDHKLDSLVKGFNDYRTQASGEQNWRNMLPVIGLLVVIGGLVIQPIYSDIADAEEWRKVTVETDLPSLNRELANLQARVLENETELGHLWSDPTIGVFSKAEWRGRVDRALSDHSRIIERGWTEEDGRQNARLEHLEQQPE